MDDKTLLIRLGELYECDELDDLILLARRVVASVCSGDTVCYSEIPVPTTVHTTADRARQSPWQCLAPRVLSGDDAFDRAVAKNLPALMIHFDEHPLLMLPLRQQTPPVATIQDHLNQSDFQRSGLYNEFFRPLDTRYQLALCPGVFDSVVLGLTINRSRKPFTDSDCQAVGRLMPHLRAAFRLFDLRMRKRNDDGSLPRNSDAAGWHWHNGLY